MFAKRFFYVCTGIFLLALSYHFGASNAKAAPQGNPIVASISPTFPPYYNVVVTANGDVYGANTASGPWTRLSNVFTP